MHILQNTPHEILFTVCKGYEKALFSEGEGELFADLYGEEKAEFS